MLKTFLNLDYSAGGDYEVTPENFPSVFAFFPVGTKTDTEIVETMSGAIFPMATDATTATDASPSNATEFVRDTANAYLVGLVVCNTSAGGVQRFRIGHSTSEHYIDFFSGVAALPLFNVEGFVSVTDLDSTASEDDLSINTNDWFGFKLSNDTDLTSMDNKGVGQLAQDLTPVTVNSFFYSTINTNITITGLSNGAFKGIALFSFNEMPTDIHEAFAWMAAQWKLGNPYIYPPWKGLVP